VAHFVKSHGLGNDYLVVDPARLPFRLTAEAIRLVCDRKRGVGSDGILAVDKPGDGSDFGVRIFNPDGSEAEKSGNGVRIFAKFLREHHHTDRDHFTIRTLGGVVMVDLAWDGVRVGDVTAAMGRATFGAPDTIVVDGDRIAVSVVSLGNPHCVVFVGDLGAVDVHGLGPKIERHHAFPGRTNVQFAQVRARNALELRIWERGAGYTLASGTSSCAAVAAAHRLGLTGPDVTVTMPGGALGVSIDEAGEIRLRGPAEEVMSGDFSADLLRHLAERA